MNLLGRFHRGCVSPRRFEILAGHLDPLLPDGSSVLDVGCGNGRLARTIADRRSDLFFEGIDIVENPDTAIPMRLYDGDNIPCKERSVDIVMMVDMLHHTDDATVLLAEACRVARRAILIKDHLRDGFLAGPTLRLMDWAGNAPYGTYLPYNYWTEEEWHAAFARLGWAPDAWIDRLGLYPGFADWILGRSLHFITRLRPPPTSR